MSDQHDAEQWRKWKSVLDSPMNRITELEKQLNASKQREAKLREALHEIIEMSKSSMHLTTVVSMIRNFADLRLAETEGK